MMNDHFENKQNENMPPLSPNNLYHRKRLYREISPLKQFNNDQHKYQLTYQDKKLAKSPLKGHYKDVQESQVYPIRIESFSKQLNTIQSSNDFNMIKPFTLEDDRKVKIDENQCKSYYNVSKSRPRENAKRLEFSAKVNKIEKISNQISNLLTFIDDNKSKKKQQSKNQENISNYKPRYDNYQERKPTYHRKLNALQQPMSFEPNVQRFKIDDSYLQSEERQKSHRKPFKYQYSAEQFQSKIKFDKNQLPKTPTKTDIRRKIYQLQETETKKTESKNKTNQKQQIINNEELNLKGKNSNINLKYYQESIKKRDEQIQNFQRNILKNQLSYQKTLNLQNTSNNQSNSNETNLRDRLRKRDYLNENQSEKEQSSKSYLTVQEVEVYKDINRKSKYNRGQQINTTPKNNGIYESFSSKIFEKNQSYQSLSNKLKNNHSSEFFRHQRRPSQNLYYKNGQNISSIQQNKGNKTAKIDEQIKKIKNQLRQCKQQKSNLRSKYNNLLSQPIDTIKQNTYSPQVQKGKNRSPLKAKIYFQSEEENIQHQDERFYDSINKINNLTNNQSQYHDGLNELRKNLVTPSKLSSQQLKKFKKSFQCKINLQSAEGTKPQTTRLGAVLGHKIEIDIQLRQQRQKFMRINDSSKWQILSSYLLTQKGLSKSAKEWQNLLIISSEEHNPFSTNKIDIESQKSIDFRVRSLADRISDSIQFYESKIKNSFSQRLLEKQKFNLSDLDLSMKGYLCLQDIICFINLHSGKFYRNRDIIFLIKWIIFENSRVNALEQISKMDRIMRIEFDLFWSIIIKFDK